MNLVTYPARPVNGGPFPKALPKPGNWYYEPKYNGWRALVHVPSGTMFNRHGQALTIAKEFSAALETLKRMHLEWLDCEALERRHGIGRGSLIVMDYIPIADPVRNFKDRHSLLELAAAVAKIPHHKELNAPIPENAVRVVMSYQAEGAGQLWDILQQCNRALGCDFYEGLVAKAETSTYPIQLRSATLDFAGWMKHRWAF